LPLASLIALHSQSLSPFGRLGGPWFKFWLPRRFRKGRNGIAALVPSADEEQKLSLRSPLFPSVKKSLSIDFVL
jgi:hypothetical protein